MKRLLTLLLLVFYISFLLSGCTININIDTPTENSTNPTDSKTIFDYIFNNGLFKKTMYESRATIYISNRATAESSAISSSDLAVCVSLAKVYADVLNSSLIQDRIKEEYPDVEYELTLESINETEVYALIATGENPEPLEEICNTAASVVCETFPEVVVGCSCKVVDYATPAQLVGAN